MKAEQIPGTLFVLLAGLAAWALGEPGALLGLAAGCAFGWWSMIGHEQRVREVAFWLACAFWAVSFLYLVWKVLV